jgi:hypothetical protein
MAVITKIQEEITYTVQLSDGDEYTVTRLTDLDTMTISYSAIDEDGHLIDDDSEIILEIIEAIESLEE